jgi:integrase
MARTVRNAKIDSRSSRAKLSERREPYWTAISRGCAMGYRRGGKGGSWIARFRDEAGRQHYEALGAADDARDPDGLSVFSFAQAQDRARTFFVRTAREMAGDLAPNEGSYTVGMVIEDYLTTREKRGSKGVRADRYAAEARIVSDIGHIDVAKITARHIREWHQTVASSPKLLRTKKTAAKRATVAVDNKDPEAVRARRSTANRLLTVLKAALNHAFHEGRAVADEAWRKVKPYRGADSPVVRFLSAPECVRLVNACSPTFRDLVRGALLTGCRYSELTRLRASDFNSRARALTVCLSKSGKARHVALNDEGQKLFASLTAGRRPEDLIFCRVHGKTWGQSHQQRPLVEASKAAKLEPPVSFHILRHTYASALAMKGVPMGVIATQLGLSDTRMTERHYAHLAPSYVTDTVRAMLPAFGIIEESNVVPMNPETN